MISSLNSAYVVGGERINADWKLLDILSTRLCTPVICLQHAYSWNESRTHI